MFKIAWNSLYCHPLHENHRFPMEKYNLLPQQLLYEGTITANQLFSPACVTDEVVQLTHTKAYLEKLNKLTLSPSEIRRTGFPLSEKLIQREKIIMQGTIDAALYALEDGVSFNIAGGTHHAFTDKGEGFCLLNDMAIAANYLLEKKKATKILIIDLDVHQGNGTAQIFSNVPQVFTMSMHGRKNYPMHKETSDLDIELDDFTDDVTYLKLLQDYLAPTIAVQKPDFIFYQAGVDILKGDKLGRLAVTLEGCKARDKIVFEACKNNNVPLAVTMGGGYAADIKTIINAHANTYRTARDVY